MISLPFTPDASAPLLIFGGPYSNLEATDALLSFADRMGIPTGNILCTGDLVAYCANPEETVNRIRQSGIAVILGNCEESIGNDADDCGCGFDEGSTCDLLSAAWYNFSKPRISEANKAWMRNLPSQIAFTYCDVSFNAIHGGIDQNNQFIFASDSAADKAQQITLAECEILLCGHSGIPFGEITDSGLWLNAGVIGMPANDGTPDGWFMLINPQDSHLRIEWHRLDYDYQSAATSMAQQGLNNGYQHALTSGLWPSLDVLPETEKRKTAVPIKLPALSYPLQVR